MRLERFVAALAICFGSVWSALAGVNGVVVDGAGKPVSGAEVFLYYARSETGAGSHLVEKIQAGEDGKFAFTQGLAWEKGIATGQLPPRFSVIARKAQTGLGYANLLANDSADDVRVNIERLATVTPTVVDGEGKPLAGVNVWTYAAIPQNAGQASMSRILFVSSDIGLGGVTDDKGQVELLVPPGMQFYLAAKKDGYARAFGDKQIVLTRGATVKGTVTGEDGKPLANAQVTLTCQLAGGLGSLFATTDEKGQYEVKDAPAQGYRMEVAGRKMEGVVADTVSAQDQERGVSATSDPFSPGSGEVVTKDLLMKKGLEVSGKVVDAQTGEPLPEIRLTAYVGRRNGAGEGRALTTDAQGRFRTSALPGSYLNINCQDAGDGTYLMDDSPQGMGQAYNTQNLKEDKKDITLKVRLRKLAPLAGTVVDAQGKPVAGMAIYIDNRLPSVTTGADGKFLVKRAPTDRDGMILATGEALGGKAEFKAGQSEVAITVLPRQDRECVATNGEGAPAGDLSFSFAPAAGTSQRGTFYTLNAAAKTDGQGKCTLKLIPGVSYRLSWSGQNGKNRDYGDGSVVASVSGNGNEPLSFTARQYLKSLSIKFEDSKGVPVPDVRLQLSNWDAVASDQRGQMYNLKSGKDGTIQLSRLAKGVLQFQVFSPNGAYRPSRYALSTDDATATCVLRKQDEPREYSVRVIGADGQAAPDTKVLLFTRTQGKMDQEEYTTDEKGLFQVPGTEQNSEIALFCDDPDRGWGTIQLQPYQDGAVVLSLRKPAAPLQLRFVDAQKRPVADAKVRVASLASGAPGDQSFSMEQIPYSLPDDLLTYYGLIQTTDKEGRVSFPRVDARVQGSVRVDSAEFGTQYKELPSSGGSPVVEMVKLARLQGKLSIKGAESPDLSGLYVNLRSDRTSNGAYVQRDGKYEFAQVLPGEYTVMVQNQGKPEMQKYKLASTPKVQFAPDETKTLDLVLEQGIPIRGKYLAMVNGKRPKLALRENDTGSFNPVQVKDDGSFELWVGEPGEYELLYESQENSYQVWPDAIKVKDRNPVEGLELKKP